MTMMIWLICSPAGFSNLRNSCHNKKICNQVNWVVGKGVYCACFLSIFLVNMIEAC